MEDKIRSYFLKFSSIISQNNHVKNYQDIECDWKVLRKY